MDTFDKKARSWIMRQVKSRNTSPENSLLKAVKAARLTGWRKHYKKIVGVPDLAFPRQRIAIFIDGCFWHGCKKCYRQPKSNIEYWIKKIERNKIRACKVNQILKHKGWRTIRIWEHAVMKPHIHVMRKIIRMIDKHA